MPLLPLILSPQLWESFLPHLDYNRSRYALGLGFILCQCIVWTAAAVLTQYIYDDHDSSPFLMTYLGMSLMATLLPIELWNERFKKASREQSQETITAYTTNPDHLSAPSIAIAFFDSFADDLATVQSPSCLLNVITARTLDLANNKKKQKLWNHKKHMLAALQIAPAMFIADWAFNAALRHTSVASATVLVSAQNVVVFLLAVLVQIEDIQLVGVLLSTVGIALTAYHDSDNEASSSDPLIGDSFAVIAAFAYATYTVQVRVFCPQNEELYKLQLLMGYIGLIILVSLLPLAAYIMYILRSSITWTALGFIAIKGFLDFFMADYFLFRSIVLTSATVATIGLALTIPMAFVADCILHPESAISIYSVIGAVAVGAGFISVSLSPSSEVRDGEQEQKSQVAHAFDFVCLDVV
ncbi:hypothetical protein ACHAXR_010068 [Thalassiosira sp. AJA248-18]